VLSSNPMHANKGRAQPPSLPPPRLSANYFLHPIFNKIKRCPSRRIARSFVGEPAVAVQAHPPQVDADVAHPHHHEARRAHRGVGGTKLHSKEQRLETRFSHHRDETGRFCKLG
jgi:hypothetical protein